MKKQFLGLTVIGAGLFGLASMATYSIKSEDFMNDNEIKFVKRIDELNGHMVRSVASLRPINLIKSEVKKEEVKALPVISRSMVNFNAPVPVINRGEVAKSEKAPKVKAAISQDLDCALTEVYSPKKYQNALTKNQFEGSLRTANGVIESLEVRLPNNEVVSIDGAKMVGNLFTYSLNGEKLNGMIFTTDNKNFMVSLTDGPFADTRFKFETNNQEESSNDNVALNDEQPQQFEEQAPAENVKIDINPQDPSFKNVVAQPQQFVQNPEEHTAELSEEQIQQQISTQGFNFAPENQEPTQI